MPKIYPFSGLIRKPRRRQVFIVRFFQTRKSAKPAVRKIRPWAGRLRTDDCIFARWARVRWTERGSALRVHRGGFIRCAVQHAGRNRQLLVEADIRRTGKHVRLAEGQVRSFVADCSCEYRQIDKRCGSTEVGADDAGVAANGEAGHCQAGKSPGRKLVRCF